MPLFSILYLLFLYILHSFYPILNISFSYWFNYYAFCCPLITLYNILQNCYLCIMYILSIEIKYCIVLYCKKFVPYPKSNPPSLENKFCSPTWNAHIFPPPPSASQKVGKFVFICGLFKFEHQVLLCHLKWYK